jgi:uncharacterized membrane protein YqjE
MLRSVRTLLGGAAELAHTRLELLGADLRVERARLAAAVIGSLVVLFFAALGVVFVAFTIMLAAWDHFRLGAAALLSLAFLAAACFGGLRLRRFAQAQLRMFDASLSELEKDQELLARSGEQREQVAQSAAQLAPQARLIERVMVAGQWIASGLMLYSLVRGVLARKPGGQAR